MRPTIDDRAIRRWTKQALDFDHDVRGRSQWRVEGRWINPQVSERAVLQMRRYVAAGPHGGREIEHLCFEDGYLSDTDYRGGVNLCIAEANDAVRGLVDSDGSQNGTGPE